MPRYVAKGTDSFGENRTERFDAISSHDAKIELEQSGWKIESLELDDAVPDPIVTTAPIRNRNNPAKACYVAGVIFIIFTAILPIWPLWLVLAVICFVGGAIIKAIPTKV